VGINLWIFGDLDSGKFALPIDFLAPDLREAVASGRTKCLQAPCCPLCGHPEFAQPTWYCRNCGVRQITDQQAAA
jgi:ribosomal protein L37AE/L43A